jgi:hypothetical protein
MYRLCRHRAAFLLASMVTNTFNTTGPALLRTAAVRDAGGFAEDLPYLEDWALAMALAARGRVRMLDQIGRLYRLHPGSLSSANLDGDDQRAWHASLRRQVRRDPASPAWLRAALPLIRVAHWARERRPERPEVGAAYYARALQGARVEASG